MFIKVGRFAFVDSHNCKRMSSVLKNSQVLVPNHSVPLPAN